MSIFDDLFLVQKELGIDSINWDAVEDQSILVQSRPSQNNRRGKRGSKRPRSGSFSRRGSKSFRATPVSFEVKDSSSVPKQSFRINPKSSVPMQSSSVENVPPVVENKEVPLPDKVNTFSPKPVVIETKPKEVVPLVNKENVSNTSTPKFKKLSSKASFLFSKSKAAPSPVNQVAKPTLKTQVIEVKEFENTSLNDSFDIFSQNIDLSYLDPRIPEENVDLNSNIDEGMSEDIFGRSPLQKRKSYTMLKEDFDMGETLHDTNPSSSHSSSETNVETESGISSMTRNPVDSEVKKFNETVIQSKTFEDNDTLFDSFLEKAFDSFFEGESKVETSSVKSHLKPVGEFSTLNMTPETEAALLEIETNLFKKPFHPKMSDTTRKFLDMTNSSMNESSISPNPTLSIIDVASDKELFDVFVKEWSEKDCFSLSLACEKAPEMKQKGGIGR